MTLFNELDVYVDIGGEPVRAGRLSASLGGARTLGGSVFRYDPAYVQTEGSYELDPLLVSTLEPIYTGPDQALFGAFEDLTPDDWGRRVIDANLANARKSDPTMPGRLNEFDYLTLTPDETRPGAIRFTSADASTWLSTATVPELAAHGLDAFADAAARLEMHEATPEDLELLGAPGSSAGGARPKVNVYVDGQLRLLKLPSSRDRHRDAEAWEYVAITLARRAGINVQRAELLRAATGKSTLALHRFDRLPSGERIGYLSARSAMGLGDQGHDQVTYEDLADTTDQLTGSDRGQLRELFKRVAFNVLVSNTDDHWKNHGFLRADHTWQLSPAFDLNPAVPGGSVQSRAISPNDDPRDRDIRNLVATATTYALSKNDTSAALAEVLQAVRSWRDVATAAGITPPEISDYESAFSERQQGFAQQAISKLSSE